MDSSDSKARRDNGAYKYYPLDVSTIALLPDEHEVVINPKNGLALLVDWGMREIRADSQFEREACRIVMQLLHDWPSFVRYEKLVALISDEPPAGIVERIEAARFTDTLEPVIAPLVAILDKSKPALARLGLLAYPMPEQGYLLTSLRDPSQQDGTEPPQA
ncbi:MAG TPA: hypothetical protein VKV37_03475 [Ktedonobacteraceae bacterium]|nr:hypothetical protein [Ktedonobacteraceae bacterium]